ncbi:MAG: hypothetical protein O2961_07005, partial [Bacteroidetes bacterium]|nr:hypothetical protein [Bacteroidota bacterium]
MASINDENPSNLIAVSFTPGTNLVKPPISNSLPGFDFCDITVVSLKSQENSKLLFCAFPILGRIKIPKKIKISFFMIFYF